MVHISMGIRACVAGTGENVIISGLTPEKFAALKRDIADGILEECSLAVIKSNGKNDEIPLSQLILCAP